MPGGPIAFSLPVPPGKRLCTANFPRRRFFEWMQPFARVRERWLERHLQCPRCGEACAGKDPTPCLHDATPTIRTLSHRDFAQSVRAAWRPIDDGPYLVRWLAGVAK